MGRTLVVGGRRWSPLLLVGVITLVATLWAAPRASAQESYVHAIIPSCAHCHPKNVFPPNAPAPTDAACTTSCHVGFLSRGANTCTACHTPGQDQSAVQTSDGCATSNCHDIEAHYASGIEGCTVGCHTTATPAAANDSAHHTIDERVAPTRETCSACHLPHETFIPEATCFDCHAGYSDVHPAPATIQARDLTLAPTALTVAWGDSIGLFGSLLYGASPFAGAEVVLQQKPTVAATHVHLATTVTGDNGAYALEPVTPKAITCYRALVPGTCIAGTVVKPALANVSVSVRPKLTIALSRTSLLLGGKLTVKGRLTPARPGGVVKLTFQRKVLGVWKTVLTKSQAVTSTADYSTYSFTYKPLRRGSWRVRASVAATPSLIAYKTSYKCFTVK
jgi:hypothetical protein